MRALITALVFANGARVSAGVVSVDVSGEGLPPVFGVSLSDGTNGEARAIINALPTPGFDRPRTATAIFAGYSTIPGRHAQEAAQLATTRFSLTLRLLPRVRPLQISIIPAVASITGTVLFTASSSGGWVSEPLGYSVEVFGSKFDRQVGGVEPEEGARGVSVFYVFGAGDITITAALDDDLDTTLPTSTTITIHRRAIGTYRISAGIRLPQLFAPRYVTNDVSRTITRFVDVELLRPVRGAAVVPLAQLTIYAGRYGFAALDPDNSTVYASSGLAGDVPYLRPVANIYDGEEWRFIYRLFSTSSVSGFRTITIGIEPTNADIAYQPHYIDITTELGTSFFLDMRTAPLDYDLRNTPTLFAGRAPVGSGYNTIPLTIAGGVGQGSYGLSVAAADGISASVRFVSFFTGGHIANGNCLSAMPLTKAIIG